MITDGSNCILRKKIASNANIGYHPYLNNVTNLNNIACNDIYVTMLDCLNQNYSHCIYLIMQGSDMSHIEFPKQTQIINITQKMPENSIFVSFNFIKGDFILINAIIQVLNNGNNGNNITNNTQILINDHISVLNQTNSNIAFQGLHLQGNVSISNNNTGSYVMLYQGLQSITFYDTIISHITIQIKNISVLNIENSILSNGRSVSNNGGILNIKCENNIQQTQQIVTFKKSTFQYSFSNLLGGAVYIYGCSQLNMDSVNIINNKAMSHGGGMYFDFVKVITIIGDINFRDNSIG